MDLSVTGPTRCPTCNTALLVVPDGDLWCGKCQEFVKPQAGPRSSGTIRQAAMDKVAELQQMGRPALALEFDGTDPNQVFQALGTAIDFSVQLVVKTNMLISLEVFQLAKDGRVAVVVSGEPRQDAAGGAPAEQDPPAAPTDA